MTFRRDRERTLLRVIDQQQQTINGLVNKLMLVAGTPWELPPHPENITPTPDPEPRDWTFHPEQEV